jgi:hypothetical protein
VLFLFFFLGSLLFLQKEVSKDVSDSGGSTVPGWLPGLFDRFKSSLYSTFPNIHRKRGLNILILTIFVKVRVNSKRALQTVTFFSWPVHSYTFFCLGRRAAIHTFGQLRIQI